MIHDMTGGSAWYTKQRLCQRNVTLHCYATNADAEILLDAKDKQDLKVVLVDEVRDAVYEQLYEYPLYTNQMKTGGAKQNTLTLLIVGGGKAGCEFLKAAVWRSDDKLCFLNIHLFDLEGTNLQERLEEECPELLAEEGNYQICIHEGDVFSGTMQSELDALGQGGLCISALGDDEINSCSGMDETPFLLQKRDIRNHLSVRMCKAWQRKWRSVNFQKIREERPVFPMILCRLDVAGFIMAMNQMRHLYWNIWDLVCSRIISA